MLTVLEKKTEKIITTTFFEIEKNMVIDYEPTNSYDKTEYSLLVVSVDNCVIITRDIQKMTLDHHLNNEEIRYVECGKLVEHGLSPLYPDAYEYIIDDVNEDTEFTVLCPLLHSIVVNGSMVFVKNNTVGYQIAEHSTVTKLDTVDITEFDNEVTVTLDDGRIMFIKNN